MTRKILPILLVSSVAWCSSALAQEPPDLPLDLVIHADQGTDTISRHIYGHFAEHLGRDIYDGFWTKVGTGEWHLREDVIEALRAIKVPNLRWPGGCFADYYHWKDGIGPRDQRPTIVNTVWGGVTEDNSFGTHEYMELVERLEWHAGEVQFAMGDAVVKGMVADARVCLKGVRDYRVNRRRPRG